VSFTPTAEQQAVADACAAGKNLVVQAAAGAGKTSTLKLAAAGMPGRGRYLTYNSAAAKAAQGAFPARVKCSTIHSLAWHVAKPYVDANRVPLGSKGAKRQSGAQIAEILGITRPLLIEDSVVEPKRLGYLAVATVNNWCLGIDFKPEPKHVPHQTGLSETGNAYLAEQVVPLAHKAWCDIYSKTGRINVNHDHYLRMWWNSSTRNGGRSVDLGVDFVMLDEAQDTNGLAAAIIQSQKNTQLIAVGDSYQSLYGWRGAIDALERWPADEVLYLQQSFRFGPAVAAEANKWLALLDAKMRVVGTPGIESAVTSAIPLPDAVLCRTNAGAMAAVMEALEANRRPALASGAGDIRAFAEAAIDLQNGRRTGHKDLWAFPDWDAVEAYVEGEDEGEADDLQMMVQLVGEYGAEDLLDVVDNRLTSPSRADVTMSTVHGAKGLEWNSVQIGGDFKSPGYDTRDRPIPLPRPLGMVAYVGVTRPKLRLGYGSLDWADEWLRGKTGRRLTVVA
jgi:superfamily I DNA/RNA helicase